MICWRRMCPYQQVQSLSFAASGHRRGTVLCDKLAASHKHESGHGNEAPFKDPAILNSHTVDPHYTVSNITVVGDMIIPMV